MSYLGQIAEIPVGLEGLNGSNNPAILRPTHLTTADNISYEAGVIKKEGGATKYNSVAVDGTTNIIGGWDWWPDATTQRQIVVTDNGKIFKDDGAGSFSTTLKSGLGTSDTNKVPVFVDAGKEVAANTRKLFIFTGENQVQVLSGNGATTSDLATPPTDWSASNFPTFGVVHNGKLWGGGNPNDPHRLYYSVSTNHEDFTGAGSGSISVYPGVGRKLVGAVSFKGLLIVWKYPKGVYIIDTSDPTAANWTVEKVSDAVGAVGPGVIVPIENDILFMSPDGQIHRLSAVVSQGSFGSVNLSTEPHMDDFALNNFSFSTLQRSKGIFYPLRQEAQFAIPGMSSSVLNVRIVLDFSIPGQVRFRTASRDVCEAIWMRQDSNGILRPMAGDDNSFVWNLDQTTKSKNGIGYLGEFTTAPNDLSYISRRFAAQWKSGQFLEVVMETLGNYNLNVDVIWDGRSVQTLTFLLGITGSILGVGALGSFVLGGTGVVNRKRRIHGGGRRISLRAYNNGAGEDFAVSYFLLHFVPGDDRLART